MATYTIISNVKSGKREGFLQEQPCLVFDSVTEYNYDLKSKITSYPIESGAMVSDHLQTENDNYFITGVVTNSPIQAYENNTIIYQEGVKRTELAIKILREIKEARQPIRLVNEFEVLEDIILTSVTFAQTPQEAEALIFKLSFEKVRYATAKRVFANVSSTRVAGKDAGKSTASNEAAGGTVKQENDKTIWEGWKETFGKLREQATSATQQ